MVDPYSAGASAIASIANISIRIFQLSYEIKAVDEKARDLLETTNATTKTLDTAKTLLNQKAHLFNELELSWMREVAFKEAERALHKTMALVEDARVDMSTSQGKVKFGTRCLYVLKESPRLQESLTSLTLAGQLLTQAMGIICNRSIDQTSFCATNDETTKFCTMKKPPPPYEESEFLTQHRRSISKTMASNASKNSQDTHNFPKQSVQRAQDDENAGYILQPEERVEEDAFKTPRDSTNPTPIPTESDKNYLAGESNTSQAERLETKRPTQKKSRRDALFEHQTLRLADTKQYIHV